MHDRGYQHRQVDSNSVFLIQAASAKPVTAKLANFSHSQLVLDNYSLLETDIVDFGVFIYDLFAKNYSEKSSPDQLRKLSLEELKRDVTFAELGLLLQSIFRADIVFAIEIAEWFTEAQQQSGSGLSAKQGDIKTIQL